MVILSKREIIGKTGKGMLAFTHHRFWLCEDSLYVLLCPCPKPGRNILIGPPCIPAVPNLYQIFWDPKPNERFFVDVQFINQTGRQRELDLSRVVFEGKNKALVPTNLCVIVNEYFGQHRRSYPQMPVFSGFADSARVNLPPQGTLIVRYEFETKASSVKMLGVSIEGISDLITTPTLRLKQRTKVIYMEN
ncbi:MAG: hypothetical protein IPP33_00640 [Flavobacteriales bacterium]|nr:hypothetical protein [Flavobacteriales bacterium]